MSIIARLAVLGFAIIVSGLIMGGISVFLFAELYLWLLTVTPEPLAVFLITLLALSISLLTFFGALKAFRAPRPGSARQAPLSGQGILMGELGQLLGQELTGAMRTHPGKTVATSLLAGFAIGASGDLRQALRRIIFN